MNRCWRLVFRKVIFHRLPLNKQCDLTHSLTFFRMIKPKHHSVTTQPQLIHLIHIGTGYEQKQKRFENALAQICFDSIDLFVFTRDLLRKKNVQWMKFFFSINRRIPIIRNYISYFSISTCAHTTQANPTLFLTHSSQR